MAAKNIVPIAAFDGPLNVLRQEANAPKVGEGGFPEVAPTVPLWLNGKEHLLTVRCREIFHTSF